MKRKTTSFVALFFVLCLAVGFTACQQGSDEVAAEVLVYSENMLAIKVTETDGKATLMDAMNNLKEEGEIDFTLSGGMVTAIHGVANDVDYNPCWMLYTSDNEMANTQWGTVVYEENTLGSAVLGAETLIVAEGELYVWSYQEFKSK